VECVSHLFTNVDCVVLLCISSTFVGSNFPLNTALR
jgi:hypothetical protein